jgi:hypothetical protein
MPVTKIIHECPYRGATTTCHTPSDGLTQSKEARYAIGYEQPNFPVPAIIGFQHTRYGTYMFDTRMHMDGMPLFRGYTWDKWTECWRD